MRTPRPRGFTLLELMVVVTIVGLLSSIALPSFNRMLLRARTAERRAVLRGIQQVVEDYYIQNDRYPTGATPWTTISTTWNPPLPPQPVKRPMDPTVFGWSTLYMSLNVQGGTYYSYMVFAMDQPAPGVRQMQVYAVGDLDADGAYSWKWRISQAVTGGMKETTVFPEDGNEDDASIYRTF